MGRGGSKRRHSSSTIKSQSQFKSKPKRTDDDTLWEDDDDEIDAFHKQRDVIPLDVTQEESDDEDMQRPVFDFQMWNRRRRLLSIVPKETKREGG